MIAPFQGIRLPLLTLLLLSLLPSGARALELEGVAGWEGDTRDQGYAFATLGTAWGIKENKAFITRISGNYLYYNYHSDLSETDVTSPGVTLMGGLRLTPGNKTILLLGGGEVRWNKEEEKTTTGIQTVERETDFSGVLQTMLDTPLAIKTRLNLLVNYDGVNQYTYGRLGLKREVYVKRGDSGYNLSLGLEGVGQGNDDIVSTQAGTFMEFYSFPLRLSLLLRGGYKKSYFEDAPNRGSGYIGVSLYNRIL